MNLFSSSNLEDDQIAPDKYWVKGNHHVFIGSGKFSSWASWAEVGLANAGTATEQLVGLGIPAFSLPGRGPQFKYSFALRQSRLLGGSVIPCKSPEELADRLRVVLNSEALRQNLGNIGRKRMGSPGGGNALASMIIKFLLVNA